MATIKQNSSSLSALEYSILCLKVGGVRLNLSVEWDLDEGNFYGDRKQFYSENVNDFTKIFVI